MMNKYYYGLFFILGASLLLSLCFIPPFDLMLDDREIFKYAGMAIVRGEVPYRDFFDHKPPLIFFINAAGMLLGGAWGLWTINTLLSLLVSGLFYRRCHQCRLPFPWLLPLLFLLMIRDNLVSLGINMTREYSTFIFVLFFYVFMGKSRWRDWLLGSLTGLIFFIQQEQVLVLLPFLIYTLLTESAAIWSRIARLAGGFGIILLPLLGYFAAHHALGYFWEDAIRFNMVWYIPHPKSMGDHFRTLKKGLDAGNYELPFMIALVLGVTSFFLRHKRRGLLIAALAALFFSMAQEFMGARFVDRMLPTDFYYYNLPLAGSVCTLLFVVFAYGDEALLANRKMQLPYIFLLCGSLTYTSLQHGTHLIRRDQDVVITSPELRYLREHRPGDYGLYVFNYNDYIYAYNELKILAPSRWIYQQMWDWYPNWDPDQAILSSIAADLIKHKTTYILLDPTHLEFFANPANAAWWASFMQSRYEPLQIPGAARPILWKRKNL